MIYRGKLTKKLLFEVKLFVHGQLTTSSHDELQFKFIIIKGKGGLV